MTGAGNKIIANRIKSVSAIGINTQSTCVVAFNTVFTNGLIGIAMTHTAGSPAIFCNTVVANGGDGINVITGATILQCIFGNMITDNTGDGIDMVSTGNAGFTARNRFRGNANTYNNQGDWITATSFSDVTSGSGTGADYVNYAGNDFNIIPTSAAARVNEPLYMSIGALQLKAPETSSTFGR